MIRIVQYDNRKFYNVTNKGYITLAQIKDFLLAGEDISVIHHKTKNNITEDVILKVLIYPAQNTRTVYNSEGLVRLLRKSQGDVFNYIAEVA